MRILFVSPRQCWPTVGGSKLREYNFARALGEHGSVTYVFFREPEFPAPAAADMPFCERLVSVRPPRRYSPGRLVRGIVGEWPLPVVNYTSHDMARTISRLIAEESFDAVHFESTHMAAYVRLVRRLLPNARILFNWHNVESEGMHRYAQVTSSRLKAAYAQFTAGRLEKVEAGLLLDSYGHFVCSERERKQLAAVASPDARIAVVENGVDTEYFRAVGGESGSGRRIVFVGLMAYHANVDAITWFSRQVWPQLRALFPDKTLTIVGANPHPDVLALRAEPGIEVTGTVPDVRPYYAEAFAAIAPLRTGAGTRLKILEAMAAGIPVVSTAIGAEGLAVTSGRNILLAESTDEWIAAFSRLRQLPCRNNLVAAGHELVSSQYDWQIIRSSLYSTYTRWLSELSVNSAAGTLYSNP